MALSGGQRQRIALARAILARPDVLILDDPLSALDVHTEEKVTRALHRILAGTTALVVAHRPVHRGARRQGGAAVRRGDRGHRQPRRSCWRPTRSTAALMRRRGPGGKRVDRGRPAPGAESPPRRPTRSAPGWPRCCAAGEAAARRPAAPAPAARSTGTLSLVVVESLAALAGPWLVGIGIDQRPAAAAARRRRCCRCSASRPRSRSRSRCRRSPPGSSSRMTGASARSVVLELRQRLFAHFQRLPVAFHERLHLRRRDLPADLRHRVDLRPVRGGPRLAGRGRADAAAGRHRDAPARLAARPGGAGRVRPADRG